jgi:hypothetical protein
VIATLGGGDARPYPPSWVDLILGRLERSRWPAWLTFGLLAVATVGVANLLPVLAGLDVAAVALRFTMIGLVPVFAIALMRHLDRVASEALDRFRPLLDATPEEVERLRYRLTVLPRREVILVLAFVTWGTVAGAATAPGNLEIDGSSIGAAALIVAFACFTGYCYGTLTLKVVRQLVLVDRIHRQAPGVDLFNVGPLYAFSRLTSQAALGMLVIVAVLGITTARQFMLASTSELATAAMLGFYATLGVAGVAAFVLPLYGLHRRIVIEKERLQASADTRLTSLLGALHDDADGLDLSRADGLSKLLGSSFQERDVLAKLPTWPWQAATLRAFVSALLLPVLVYVLARAAERVVL